MAQGFIKLPNCMDFVCKYNLFLLSLPNYCSFVLRFNFVEFKFIYLFANLYVTIVFVL